MPDDPNVENIRLQEAFAKNGALQGKIAQND